MYIPFWLSHPSFRLTPCSVLSFVGTLPCFAPSLVCPIPCSLPSFVPSYPSFRLIPCSVLLLVLSHLCHVVFLLPSLPHPQLLEVFETFSYTSEFISEAIVVSQDQEVALQSRVCTSSRVRINGYSYGYG